MTTTVTVQVNCNKSLEVEIRANDEIERVLQNGDKATFHVTELKSIRIAEVPKARLFPADEPLKEFVAKE
jgi:hypothetical protein